MRYDHGGTGWHVGRGLTDDRFHLDGLEANYLFRILARKIHKSKFKYHLTEFRSLDKTVTVVKGNQEFEVMPWEHLLLDDGGFNHRTRAELKAEKARLKAEEKEARSEDANISTTSKKRGK